MRTHDLVATTTVEWAHVDALIEDILRSARRSIESMQALAPYETHCQHCVQQPRRPEPVQEIDDESARALRLRRLRALPLTPIPHGADAAEVARNRLHHAEIACTEMLSAEHRPLVETEDGIEQPHAARPPKLRKPFRHITAYVGLNTARRVYDPESDGEAFEAAAREEELEGLPLVELAHIEGVSAWDVLAAHVTNQSTDDDDAIPVEDAEPIYSALVGRTETVVRTDYSGRKNGSYTRTTKSKRTKELEKLIARYGITPRALREAAKERAGL